MNDRSWAFCFNYPLLAWTHKTRYGSSASAVFVIELSSFGGPTITCYGDLIKIDRWLASPSTSQGVIVVGSKRPIRGLHLNKRVPESSSHGTGGGIIFFFSCDSSNPVGPYPVTCPFHKPLRRLHTSKQVRSEMKDFT